GGHAGDRAARRLRADGREAGGGPGAARPSRHRGEGGLMAGDEAQPRLPLRGWALELARRWNSGAYALFILHGNVFDVFPVQSPTDLGYGPLKTFLARRLFPERAYLIFYDIADGLTFGSADMQTGFFEWLAVYDQVEKTDFHREGPPREFTRLAPLLGRFLASGWATAMAGGRPLAEWSDLSAAELATRTAGLTLLRIQHLLAEAVRNAERVTAEHVAASKKRLIEEYCQGLVRFKDPRPGLGLDAVATHAAAKQKLRELAWLIKNEKDDVLERGLLVPGRGGVGKSFLIDCFASECGLPVMEMGEFRSKWVGET